MDCPNEESSPRVLARRDTPVLLDRTWKAIVETNFVMRNMTNLRLVVERRGAESVGVIFFLIELKHVGAEIIPIDQTAFFGIQLDEEESLVEIKTCEKRYFIE